MLETAISFSLGGTTYVGYHLVISASKGGDILIAGAAIPDSDNAIIQHFDMGIVDSGGSVRALPYINGMNANDANVVTPTWEQATTIYIYYQ